MIGVLAASVALIALVLKIKRQKREVHRKYWVNPYLAQRSERGRFFRDVSIIF